MTTPTQLPKHIVDGFYRIGQILEGTNTELHAIRNSLVEGRFGEESPPQNIIDIIASVRGSSRSMLTWAVKEEAREQMESTERWLKENIRPGDTPDSNPTAQAFAALLTSILDAD